MEVSRHTAVLALCALVAAIGIGVFALGGGVMGTSEAAESASATFGLGRDTVTVTPGIKVTASLSQPRGVEADAITWRLSGIGEAADRISAKGTGPDVSFVAPASGKVVLLAEVEVDGENVTTRTTFDVVPVDSVVGVNVSTRGTVEIDGGRAVQGEALAAGAKVDATEGEIEYVVKSTANGTQAGSIRAGGSSFSVTARVSGVRVVNTVAVSRDTSGASRELTADVEHVDGVRYVEVQTPDAVAMVKGTRFRASTDTGHSWIQVDDGDVDVYDRFRMYMPPASTLTGSSASVTALDFVRAADTWRWASGGPAAAALEHTRGASPDQGGEGDPLESGDDLIDQLVDAEVESSAPPPEAGTTDGSSPFLTSDDSDNVDETVSDSDSSDDSSGSSPTFDDGTSDNGSDSDGGSSDPGTPTPVAKPPLDAPYILEDYTQRPCTAKHEMWNKTAIGGKHLCWPQTSMDGYAGDRTGYSPLTWGGTAWGCFRLHTVWSGEWCFPVAESELQYFTPPYDPPKARKRTASGVSDPESMGCLDRADLELVHVLWDSDSKCHAAAKA